MTRLRWNQDSNTQFEFGVDRGVLYLESGLAVPWNGITKVNENQVVDDVSSYYFDGVKYLETATKSVYQMTLSAVSAPTEFSDVLGDVAVIPGFILTKQYRSKFGLSYRTKIGNDLGYKLHLVYNAVAKSSNIVHSTINSAADIPILSWTINTTPLSYPGLNPSAHIVFDSTKTKPEVLGFVETILYGDDANDGRLLTLFELSNIFENWNPLLIDYSDSGFSTFLSELGDLSTTKIDGIMVRIHTTRLGLTSDPGIYRLES